MDMSLQPMEQLSYLFYENKVHEESGMNKLIEEIIDIHEKYINSDAYWDAYTYELERSLIMTKIRMQKMME